ncbi:MAG: hypothetical protein RLP09_03585 [Sandaracinaceae bacterium]
MIALVLEERQAAEDRVLPLGQEILDELDPVADLRELAVELRDRRMQRRTGEFDKGA